MARLAEQQPLATEAGRRGDEWAARAAAVVGQVAEWAATAGWAVEHRRAGPADGPAVTLRRAGPGWWTRRWR